MAGVGQGLVLGVKFILILCFIQRIYSLGHASNQQETRQDHHGQTSGTQLLSFYKLQGFSGYIFIQKCTTTGRTTTGGKEDSRKPQISLLNRQKVGHLTQLIIIALARSGNVESNPGPCNENKQVIKKRKYTVKMPCSVCAKGIRSKPIHCKSCKNIYHVRCISDHKNELFDNHIDKNTNIPYMFKKCSNENMLRNPTVIRVPKSLEQSNSPPPPLPSTTGPAAAAAVVYPTPLTQLIKTNHSELIQESVATNSVISLDYICKYCQEHFVKGDKKRICEYCKNIFHPRCRIYECQAI